jgi:peptidoglycan/LPS O-acetylase OafA/YrhL
MRRIPSLDGVRALSIGLVLIAHMAGTRHSPDLAWIEMFGDIGNLGVRIFFVVSGFLTTMLLYRQIERTGRLSVSAFLLRRALRILPAFAVYIGVIAVATGSGLLVVNARDLLSAMTFTVDFRANRSWYVGHLWSLSVEQQFYLCWPLLLALAGRSRMGWVAAAGLGIGPISRVVLHVCAPEWRNTVGECFPTVIDALASGSLLAAFHDQLTASPRYLQFLRSKVLILTPLAAIALNVVLPHIAFSYTVGQTLLNALIALMLHRVMLVSESAGARILNTGPLVAFGALSYSLYLWQQPFLNRQSDLFIAAFPLNIGLALGAALLSYHFIEQPALKLRGRFGA